MHKNKIDPIEQIHKICRKHRIVPLLIMDEDFTEIYEDIKFTEEDLDELKSNLYDAILNDFGNSLEQTLSELGYDKE